jgi:tetraacyldisaccharide 4'-kinase
MKLLTRLLRLLYPFAALYGGISTVRNYLYNRQYLKSYQPPIPTLIVGNLTVGGTGKTPHVEYLIRLLAHQYHTATLSRGYGRKTKGFIVATDTPISTSVQHTSQPTASMIGDEPMQFFTKYAAQIAVAVCEKRVIGVKNLLKIFPSLQVVLLDDAFQHRTIRGTLHILLTDYQRIFYQDFVLPAGLLRERRIGAKRADIVIVSKCPTNLSTEQQASITAQLRPYLAADTPVFFTCIKYQAWQAITPIAAAELPPALNIILLTGIAHTEQLVHKITQNTAYQLVEHLKFKDHHQYTLQDLKTLRSVYQEHQNLAQPTIILTTEKDMVRLLQNELSAIVKELPIFYLPITIEFLTEQQLFDEKIKTHIRGFYSKSLLRG